MGGGGNLPLGDLGVKPMPAPVDPATFMGGGKARALGNVDTALKAIQAMKTQQYNQGFQNAQRQYEVANHSFEALYAKWQTDKQNPALAEALARAQQDRQDAYGELLNYGSEKGGKGKKGGGGGAQGQDGQQAQNSPAQKVAQYLKRILTGPPMNTAKYYPQQPPTAQPPGSMVPGQGLQPGATVTFNGRQGVVRSIQNGMADVDFSGSPQPMPGTTPIPTAFAGMPNGGTQ